jgi:predicted DNA-binding transcriptional regulator AlpA
MKNAPIFHNGKSAARFLGVGNTTFWKLVESDPLFPDAVEMNGVRRWLESDLDDYIEAKKVANADFAGVRRRRGGRPLKSQENRA